MKTVILLLFLKLYFEDIFCNDNILSKFHQDGYKIKDVRLEILSYSEKHFNSFDIKTFKHNRTTPAVNASMNMKISMKDKIEVLVQAFKFLSNEYRHFPIRFQVNLKKTVDSNALGLSAIKDCGNMAYASFEKDITYYVCNFVVDETRFPPLMPNGRYKADLKLLYLNEEIAFMSGYAEIYTPISYPQN